jgi:glycosyltransferase involved in cell wall biosynthesis
MADDPLRRAEDEADYAWNLARLAREELRALQPEAAATPDQGPQTKQKLHGMLDTLQNITPEFVRAAVRPLYLNLFYYRIYPEYAKPTATLEIPPHDALAGWSGFAPFIEYKGRVCRGLPMDFRTVSVDGVPGLVSVVLPVYNGARYVEEAILSVLRQTHAAFELIVVDDGSTDETPALIVRHASDPRVHLIRQENRGLPGALNTGFQAARGEYFTWVSADNRPHPEMLAELVGFLERNTDAEMVYADEELIGEDGQPTLETDFCRIYQTPPGSHILRRPLDPGELSFVQNNYIGGCFLYRAWAARALGPYAESCFGFEDYDYWLRMNALFRIAHLGERQILHSYRLHPGSLTARDKELRIAQRTRYFLAVEEERRRFFAESFDITFTGRHPWFRTLAQAYRKAGHNVCEIESFTEQELYLHRVTRAFRKTLVVGTAGTELGELALVQGNRVAIAGQTWTAAAPEQIAYPLLAIANHRLWSADASPH